MTKFGGQVNIIIKINLVSFDPGALMSLIHPRWDASGELTTKQNLVDIVEGANQIDLKENKTSARILKRKELTYERKIVNVETTRLDSSTDHISYPRHIDQLAAIYRAGRRKWRSRLIDDEAPDRIRGQGCRRSG